MGGKSFAQDFLDCMNRNGNWDDGCFYYNRTAAPELGGLIGRAGGHDRPTPSKIIALRQELSESLGRLLTAPGNATVLDVVVDIDRLIDAKLRALSPPSPSEEGK